MLVVVIILLLAFILINYMKKVALINILNTHRLINVGLDIKTNNGSEYRNVTVNWFTDYDVSITDKSNKDLHFTEVISLDSIVTLTFNFK